MNCTRTLRYAIFPALLCAFVSARSALGTEPTRIWVDANGLFSVEARLIKIVDQRVVLLRDDGKQISIALDKLSDRDQEYIGNLQPNAVANDNPLRLRAPEPPKIKPLALVDLPPSDHVAAEGSMLRFSSQKNRIQLSSQIPGPLVPDPSPWTVALGEAHIPIDKVDVYDNCSRPIPIVTMTSSGTPSTSLAMSVSSGLRIPGAKLRNQIIRFDVGQAQAYVAWEHDESVQLLDHHAASGRSLLLVGSDALGRGGSLAIASGWDRNRVKLSHRRALVDKDNKVARVPHLRWARWVDEEHVIAVIDETLSLWNIVSGDQVYRIDGIDHRAQPAISAGRRYVAVPCEGSVQLYSTQTGKQLGGIGVEKQVVPGVSFSPLGHALAIATSRRMRSWDLASAALSTDIVSRRGLGTGSPIWIDSDLVLSSSGVLLSAFRGIPVWRYEIAATETVSIGKQVAIFRKHPATALTILSLPHEAAADAMYWIDNSPTKIDTENWRVPGRSLWTSTGWDDRDVMISAAAGRLK